jgi:hypothetical protein
MGTKRSFNITSLNLDPIVTAKSGLPINQASSSQIGPSTSSNPITSPNVSTIVLTLDKLAVYWTPTTPGTIDIGVQYAPDPVNGGTWGGVVELPDGSQAESYGIRNTGKVDFIVPNVPVFGSGWQIVLSWNDSQSQRESRSGEFSILKRPAYVPRPLTTNNTESALEAPTSYGAMVTANGEVFD